MTTKTSVVKAKASLEGKSDRETVALLAQAINKVHQDWRHPMIRSFFMGLMTALGATFGFAIFLWILGYLLTVLNIVPGFSAMAEAIREFVDQSSNRS